jgi:hypothetical protein
MARSSRLLKWNFSSLLGDTAGPVLFVVGWMFAGFSVVALSRILGFVKLDEPESHVAPEPVGESAP